MKKNAPPRLWFSFLLCLALSVALFSAGCGGFMEKRVIQSPQYPTGTQVPVQQNPLSELENLFARGEYARVEVLGQRLLDDDALSPDVKGRAAHLYAVAAVRAGHPNLALDVLDKWRGVAAAADTTREWQDVWSDAITQMPSREARTQANAVYQDSGRPMIVRGIAAIAFAVRQWEDNDLGETMRALEGLYRAVPDLTTKAALEGRLAMQLQSASPQAISLIAPSVTSDNQGQFPYSIVLIDQLRRQTLQTQTRMQATAALQTIEKTISLADPSLFKGPPAPIQVTASYTGATGMTAPAGGGNRNIALALPLSGPYGSVAGKIVAGAEAAVRDIPGASLTVIDTTSPAWLSQVEALPADTAVVGGPLVTDDYTAAKSRGVVSKKAFLTFLPALAGNDEGTVAWRFFSSAQDQVRAVVEFSANLGISKFGAFYPSDSYGRRMVELFEAQVRSRGSSVHAVSYAPGQPETWMRSAGELFSGGGGFRAIFLPDSWKTMDTVIPNLFYHQAAGKVLLGSSLWEQGIAGQTSLANPNNYALAVFPGTWNGASPSAHATQLQMAMQAKGMNADFWTGLGYDYARFAAALPVQAGWTPGSVNSALANAGMGWSIAPIRWDHSGRAAQDLFLFTPRDGSGYVPVDREAFRATVQQVR